MIYPQTTKSGVMDMQVCVPAEFTDEQVKVFADSDNPAGTDHGWQIRREGHPLNAGDPERVRCSSRAGCVHIMLEC